MMANVKAPLLTDATGQPLPVRRTAEIDALRWKYRVSDILMIKELRSQTHGEISLLYSVVEDTLADFYRIYYHNVGQDRAKHICDRFVC